MEDSENKKAVELVVKMERRLNAARKKKNDFEKKMQKSLQEHENHAEEMRERKRYEDRERIREIDEKSKQRAKQAMDNLSALRLSRMSESEEKQERNRLRTEELQRKLQLERQKRLFKNVYVLKKHQSILESANRLLQTREHMVECGRLANVFRLQQVEKAKQMPLH